MKVQVLPAGWRRLRRARRAAGLRRAAGAGGPAAAGDGGGRARPRPRSGPPLRCAAGGAAATTWPNRCGADLADDALTVYAIEHSDRLVGAIQWYAETEPDYRHASLDVFLDPAVRGTGLGGDAIRTLVRHLVDEYGHHRFTIDPAAANTAAIRAYAKVGFRPVGIMPPLRAGRGRALARRAADGPARGGVGRLNRAGVPGTHGAGHGLVVRERMCVSAAG